MVMIVDGALSRCELLLFGPWRPFDSPLTYIEPIQLPNSFNDRIDFEQSKHTIDSRANGERRMEMNEYGCRVRQIVWYEF